MIWAGGSPIATSRLPRRSRRSTERAHDGGQMAVPRRIAFDAFVTRRIEEASASTIQRLTTIFDRNTSSEARAISNAWSRRHYDGEFHLRNAAISRPHISLVFVQSRDG